MGYVEKEIEKVFYPIKEVAEMLGVNISMVRYWENEFDILRPAKNKKGDRFFTKKDLENIKLIHHLVKEKGYTLDGAKRVLKEKRNLLESSLEIRNSLIKLRDFLKQLDNSL